MSIRSTKPARVPIAGAAPEPRTQEATGETVVITLDNSKFEKGKTICGSPFIRLRVRVTPATPDILTVVRELFKRVFQLIQEDFNFGWTVHILPSLPSSDTIPLKFMNPDFDEAYIPLVVETVDEYLAKLLLHYRYEIDDLLYHVSLTKDPEIKSTSESDVKLHVLTLNFKKKH